MEFDGIIGYDSIKIELKRICDIIKNPLKYKSFGVKAPKGIMLYGSPGVGKSLFANKFIEACGIKSFVCRKNEPNGDFVKFIKETFDKAKENAPSIVFLDDMDKFANEDENHKNAEEYVTIQSCIDDSKGNDVLVFATANDLSFVPDSLIRAGRFDILINVKNPRGEDSVNIIKHYLSQKNYVADINAEEIARILNGRSCAELESIINQAGIYAGFDNKKQIEFEDIIKACKRVIYDAPETIKNQDKEVSEYTFYHEAGHALISELLQPKTVTMISAEAFDGDTGGFTSYFREDKYWNSIELMKNRVCVLLGGKASVEVVFGKIDVGCSSDLERAFSVVSRFVEEYAMAGFENCNIRPHYDLSDDVKTKQDNIVAIEIERLYRKTKELLINNRNLLDAIVEELKIKKTLLGSDVQNIINSIK